MGGGGTQIENRLADGNADRGGRTARSEDAERKVLNREVRSLGCSQIRPSSGERRRVYRPVAVQPYAELSFAQAGTDRPVVPEPRLRARPGRRVSAINRLEIPALPPDRTPTPLRTRR